MNKDITGGLTPRSNDGVGEMRFSGGFGQTDGFASVLIASVRRSGEACLTLHYTANSGPMVWSVMLTNQQRYVLADFLRSYDPVLWEAIDGTLGT